MLVEACTRYGESREEWVRRNSQKKLIEERKTTFLYPLKLNGWYWPNQQCRRTANH